MNFEEFGIVKSLLAMLLALIFATVLFFILPEIREREQRRLKIVWQHHCDQYGPSIDKWAKEKNVESPC